RHTRFSRDWSSDVCSSDLLDEDIPEEVKFWTMRVPGSRLRRAVERLSGKDPGTPRTVRVSRWTDSGRAATISVNGVDVGGNALRAELGGEQFKIGRASCREGV